MRPLFIQDNSCLLVTGYVFNNGVLTNKGLVEKFTFESFLVRHQGIRDKGIGALANEGLEAVLDMSLPDEQ